MSATQRQQAMALIEAYVRNARQDVAQAELDKAAAAGIETLHFAWAGSHTPGKPHYYRVHGPTLLIEYDNTQNGANHVHSVWHNPPNSFGQDLLHAHYKEAHPAAR
jgi:formylglycine-generating enzyme required for sulfatase activity